MTNVYRNTLFKHLASNASDCPIEWLVDFGAKEIRLRASFISPALIIDCIRHMSQADERFKLAGITDPLQISNSFQIQLQLVHGDMPAVQFKLNVYKLQTGSQSLDRLEIELTPTEFRLN